MFLSFGFVIESTEYNYDDCSNNRCTTSSGLLRMTHIFVPNAVDIET